MYILDDNINWKWPVTYESTTTTFGEVWCKLHFRRQICDISSSSTLPENSPKKPHPSTCHHLAHWMMYDSPNLTNAVQWTTNSPQDWPLMVNPVECINTSFSITPFRTFAQLKLSLERRGYLHRTRLFFLRGGGGGTVVEMRCKCFWSFKWS